MVEVQKMQEQFSAGPSLDIAAPAHPCARGIPSIPGRKKRGDDSHPLLVLDLIENRLFEPHPVSDAVVTRTIGNGRKLVPPGTDIYISTFVGQVVDKQIHAPAARINTGSEVANVVRVLRKSLGWPYFTR